MNKKMTSDAVQFAKGLMALQKKYDLWFEADTHSPIIVSNEQMDGEFIEIYWEGEEIKVKFEPTIISVKGRAT